MPLSITRCSKFRICLILICFFGLTIFGLLLRHFYKLDTTFSTVESFSEIFTKNSKTSPPTFQTKDFSIFMQVSDLHFSIENSSYWGKTNPNSPQTGNTREADFIILSNFIKKAVQPKVLLLTGDLVHATGGNNKKSGQYEEEWEIYKSTIEQSGLQGKIEKSKWNYENSETEIKILDILGNHDTFNLVNFEKFEKYRQSSKDEIYKYQSKFRKFNFIPVKAGRFPGIKKPYNFIGDVSNEHFSYMEKELLKSSSQNDGQNKDVNIFYGHYPTGCLLKTKKMTNFFQKHANIYLSGHLHTGYSKMPEMWTLSRNKNIGSYLEAECGDWKDYRVYRIIVVDNGVLSFRDFTFESQKRLESEFHIVPTAPKNFRQLIPDNKEPYFSSTFGEIRFFVFSGEMAETISTIIITLYIDDQDESTIKSKVKKFDCNFSSLPLVTCDISSRRISQNDIETFKIVINGKYQNFGVQNEENGDLILRNFDSRNGQSQANTILIDQTSKFVKVILLSYAESFMPGGYYLALIFSFVILVLPNLDFLKGVQFFDDCLFSKCYYRKILKSEGARFIKLFLNYWFLLAFFGPWHVIEVISTGNYGLIGPFGIVYIIFKSPTTTINYTFDPAIFLKAFQMLLEFIIPMVFILPQILYIKWLESTFNNSSITQNNTIHNLDENNSINAEINDDQTVASNQSSCPLNTTNTNVNDHTYNLLPNPRNKKFKRILFWKILSTFICGFLAYRGFKNSLEFCKYFGYITTILNFAIPFHHGGIVIYPYLVYFIWDFRIDVKLKR